MVQISVSSRVAHLALALITLSALAAAGGEHEHEAANAWDPESAYQETSIGTGGVEASWVVDPTVPGEDLPPKGRSLFDALFTVERSGQRLYEVPFPFTELIKNINAHLPRTKTGGSTAKQVLIPLGRSLQRYAAAPDYFKHPRVVVAVDSEPDNPGALLLKDRLFLGYQERANIIEVISYNEEAGRFEFQVVRDYGPGLKPQVFYARRTICTSCHQNGGPIFPKAAWSETNSNPKIAARLWDEQQNYDGIPGNRMAVAPFAVDSATDRANLFSAYQLLWREGCGGNTANARRCRATAFTAMLQYRLTGEKQFDTQSTRYRNRFLAASKKSWETRWPGGIKIPNPDIPNRDPLLTNGRISAQLDPLILRPSLEVWLVHRPGDVERVIKGLSEFITAADIRYLDADLFDRGRQSNRARKQFNSTCELNGKRLSDPGYRVSFACRVRSEADNDSFGMEGRLYVEADRVTDGVIDALHFNDGTTLKTLDIAGGTFVFNGHQWTVSLRLHHRRTGLHARLPNGNALTSVEFRWTNSTPTGDPLTPIPSQQSFMGDAILSVMDDFAPVHSAIEELASGKDESLFSFSPFRGARTMRALFTRLGIAVDGDVCCNDGAPMPVAKVDSGDLPAVTGRSSALVTEGGLQAFYRYCATCHRTEAPFPPNFMQGDADRVAANLTQCAHRIWYRLRMWQLPEERRPKTPMPPITMLHASKLSVERWRESDELAGLQEYVTDLLRSQNDEASGLLYRDYETLPECLQESG